MKFAPNTTTMNQPSNKRSSRPPFFVGTLWVEDEQEYPASEITLSEAEYEIDFSGTDEQMRHQQRSRIGIVLNKTDVPGLYGFLLQYIDPSAQPVLCGRTTGTIWVEEEEYYEEAVISWMENGNCISLAGADEEMIQQNKFRVRVEIPKSHVPALAQYLKQLIGNEDL
jgi:hypothetical protein